MGLNFYGRDFSQSGMKDVLGHDYTASLERKGAVLHWDEAFQEHKLTYKTGSEKHEVYYPSTKALQVSQSKSKLPVRGDSQLRPCCITSYVFPAEKGISMLCKEYASQLKSDICCEPSHAITQPPRRAGTQALCIHLFQGAASGACVKFCTKVRAPLRAHRLACRRVWSWHRSMVLAYPSGKWARAWMASWMCLTRRLMLRSLKVCWGLLVHCCVLPCQMLM